MTTLMIQGTTSDAGKSIFVAGLCRVLKRRGYSVAPFKPQNMALNSAVTLDGGEIGRAQAVQAMACDLEPHTDMNPVLLKPNTDTAAQVIIHGKAIQDMDAQDYHQYKNVAMSAVLESHTRLSQQYDVIIVEGAGSPAEINLRDRDIANMGFAEAIDCDVLLIADIDRGGVFAHLVGTLDVLSDSEQARIRGFIINRFRGDIALLEPGLDWLLERTHKPVLGVLPYLHGLHIEAEDALTTQPDKSHTKLNIIVPVLPRISNHTDFDALRLHPDINLQYIGADFTQSKTIPPCDLVILPGSKSVRDDLHWLKQQGWDDYLQKHLRYGGKLLGICGGFQMLGQFIHDPQGIEGTSGSSEGLGYFDLHTTLNHDKQLTQRQGRLCFNDAKITGYEIHNGISRGDCLENPFVMLDSTPEGAVSGDRQIAGTYLHGLFDHAEARNALLEWCGLEKTTEFDYEQIRLQAIDRLADAIEQHIDIDRIIEMLRPSSIA